MDSSRRIDLLCIDADANLVVNELKRTENGNGFDGVPSKRGRNVIRNTHQTKCLDS